MSKKYTTNFLEDTNGSTGSANQVLISTASGIDWVDGSGSAIIGGPYLKDTTDTFTGSLTIVGDIRGSGQQLILNAGESYSYATGQTAELVYLNAEAGIQINSSPDNWASGWGSRNTAYINRADASSYLPGDLSIAAGSQLFLDGGGNTYIYQDVADRVRFFVGGAEFMRFTESTANDINFFHNTTISGDLTVSGGDITLGGATGRIQGIDTISSGTDAVNRNYVDTEIANIPSGLAFEGNWNASTDTPTLAGTTQDNGKFWIVSVAGSTNLSGITDWAVGDWAIYVDNGAGTDAWQKVDNSSTLSGLGAAGKVAFWSTTANVSFNNNFSYDGTNLTVPRLRVGDGTDGYFYSDSAGRTAFRSGDFYIQGSVNNYYNYATNQYHGNTSGDNHYFRGNPLSGNNWSITAAGAISAASTITASGGFLVPYTPGTKKPMINLAGATNYGLWHTEASNDIFSFDFGGVSKQQFFQSGNATFAGDLTVSGGDIVLGGTGRIQGVDTVSATTDAANKAYVDNAIAGVPQGTVTGSGVNQRLAFWNGTSSLSSDDELTWDGVNLNIGTYAGTGDCELRLFGSTPNNSFSTLKTTNGNLHIDSDNGHTVYLNYYSGGSTSVVIGNGNGGTSNTHFFANGNATVGADLTVSGGYIILSGTGRIQGIDTVSAGTDAANKTYVDNAVAGVPQGDITAVTAGTFLTGGGTSGDVTLNADASKLAHIVDSSNGSVTSGWITVAQASGSRKAGEVYVTDSESGDHSYIRIEWMRSYADSNFTVLNCGGHANRIQGVRVLEDTSNKTYGKKYLQVKVTATSNYSVIVTAPGTIPNYGDFIAETPVLENSKTGYNIKGNTLEDLQNSSIGSEQGITSGGNIELNDARYVFTKGDVLSLSAGGAGSGTEIVLDDAGSVIKLNSDTIAKDTFIVSSLTDGTGDDVFIANSNLGTFTLGDTAGIGDEALITGDTSSIYIKTNGTSSLIADSSNDISIPNGNLLISNQIGVNTTNFNPQAGIIVNGNQTFGIPGGGANVNSRYLSIEGNADSAGEGSGRIFFTEHNSTTAAMDNYGMSLGYRGGATSIVGASGETWSGLSQIGNGEWGMWGHNNSANGALIMRGDRAATYVDFSGNNIQGITDAYIADQIIHTGDTNTYMQFHAADQWRVVTGGVERLEVNNSAVTVNATTFIVNESVGIGTTSPSDKLHVNGTVRSQAPATSDWALLGYNSAGSAASGLWFDNGDGELLLRDDSGNLNVRLRSDTSSYINGGNLGLGTTSPAQKLTVNSGRMLVSNTTTPIYIKAGSTYKSWVHHIGGSDGYIFAPSTADNGETWDWANQTKLGADGVVTAKNFQLSSDRRFKNNIKDIKDIKVEAAFKSFEMESSPGEKRYGVVAQELEKTNPELVGTDHEGFKSVKYIDLLIAKIAELEARLEKLEK